MGRSGATKDNIMEQSRSDILGQLAAGTISAEQAAAQLRGGATAPVPPEAPVPPMPPAAPAAPSNMSQRWMRIRVTDLETGRAKVNVNLPLTWVAAGLRMGATYAPQLDNMDLAQLLSDLDAGANGQLIDVEDLDDGERVQIFVD
jgi:hypothetical protein